MRADPSFGCEDELQEWLARAAPDYLRFGQDVAVAREVSWGHRVVDVALAALPCGTTNTLSRLPSVLANTTNLQLYALAAMAQSGQATADDLAELFALPMSRLEGVGLGPLFDWGLISRIGPSYGLTEWRALIPTALLAVEVKLNDWREGLPQACDYLSIADYAYIAVPSEAARGGASRRDFLRDAGVGLLTVRRDEGMSIAVRAPRNPRPSECFVPWVERIRVLRSLAAGRATWSTQPRRQRDDSIDAGL